MAAETPDEPGGSLQNNWSPLPLAILVTISLLLLSVFCFLKCIGLHYEEWRCAAKPNPL